MAPIVLFDACVLYSAPLRDLLVRLALVDLFQARWTDAIHDEWVRGVLADRPDIAPESLARCRRLMDQHVSDCLVTGYESLIPTLSLPDAEDRHVLAAAIHGGARLIVTFNLSDFPNTVLEPLQIEASHPDAFVARLFDESPDAVLLAAKLQRAGLRNPPKSVDEFLASLEQCRLRETVLRLRSRAGAI